MSFAMDSFCMTCYLERNIKLVRSLGPETKTTAFTRELMKILYSEPVESTAPMVSVKLAHLLHDMYGLELDRYRQEKIDSNRFVLERMDEIRSRVEAAEDPIYAGLQFAILGNYLDFSALQGNVSFEKLDEMLSKAKEIDVSGEVFDAFCADLAKGKKLLYLTDNAGEIGFDRVLGEAIAKKYPHLEITFCVRGDVTQNDATRQDAAEVGVPFRVIDNGNNVAGTQIELLGEEAKQALETADVILAKGMGNTETMFGCGYNVYYAFLIKCPRFARIFGKSMMTPMLVQDNQTIS